MTESRRVRPPRARAARIRGVLAWSEPRAGGTIPYLAAKLTCPAESTSMMTPGLVSRSQARTQQAALDARDASYSATTSLAAGPREPMYRPTMSSGRVGGLVSCRYHPATVQSGRVLVSATIRTWRSLHPWSSASASSRSRSSTPGWSRSRTASIALAWLMASDQPTFTGQTPVGPPQPRGSEQAAPATTVGSPGRWTPAGMIQLRGELFRQRLDTGEQHLDWLASHRGERFRLRQGQWSPASNDLDGLRQRYPQGGHQQAESLLVAVTPQQLAQATPLRGQVHRRQPRRSREKIQFVL